MNSKRLTKVLSYVLVAVVSAAVTMGAVYFFLLNENGGESKLTTLEKLIQNYFIGEYDETEIEDAAANAMIEALGDRWSYYIPADSWQAYQEQMKNAYVGIGVTIQARADEAGLDVQSVTAGGPAEEAGLMAGDRIVGVDGKDISGMAVSDVKTMIQGESGTGVKLTILRDGAELELEVTRREIKTPVATAKLLEGNIGYIKIANFNSNCADETIAAIEQMIGEGATKLLFDVRYNPGGYASELVEVLDYLLPEGKLFTRVDYSGKESTDMSDAHCIDLPMAVLVNADSYSAAEFFAAALSEYGVATVVGEKTVGKGYFQTTFQLPDGSAVGLSIGKYYTPKGESLAGVGITPDVEVAVSDEIAAKIYAGTLDLSEDPQALAAMDALK